jgi:competence protein ComEC
VKTPDVLPEPDSPSRLPAAGRAPLLWVVLPMLAGYVLGDLGLALSPKILLALALPPLAIVLFVAVRAPAKAFHQRGIFRVWAGCYFLAGTLLAWAWHGASVPTPPVIWSHLPPREATLTLRVTYVYAPRPDDLTRTALGRVVVAPKILPELNGVQVYFRGRLRPGEPPPVRGAMLELTGLLAYIDPAFLLKNAPPETSAGARFNAYLRHQGVWFTLKRWHFYREAAPPPAAQTWLLAQNERLEQSLRHGPAALENPFGDIYVAMMLGKTTLLDDIRREAFTLTGVMYFFAISGLHVVIMAGALGWCLRRVPRLPPLVGDLVTLAFLWLYTEITGGSPSARRAALMFTFYIAARWLQRPRGSLAAWVAASAVTLAADPTALWSPGFQLSYCVVLGLLLYALPLLHWARARFPLWRDLPVPSRAPWQKCMLWLWDKLLASIAISWTALLCSAPLTAEYFGVVSASGLLLSFLLVPLATVVLCSGVAAMLLGLVPWPPFTWLSWLVNTIGLAGTAFMDGLVEVVAEIPGLHTRLQLEPYWSGQVAAVAVLVAMLAARPRVHAPRPWIFLLPLGVLAVFGILTARPL